MKIKRFESKEEKVKEQEVLFTAKSLEKDKEEKPSFKTEVEDNEKVQKEFKKSMDKIEKFESFITINIDNVENIECENEWEEGTEEESSELNGCGCCDSCTGQEECECCDDCSCGSSSEESNPESDVKVMGIEDFINSLNK